MKKWLLRIIEICFVAVFAVTVFAGLTKTLFMPEDIIAFENRKANKVPEIGLSTLADFASNEFQTAFDSALSDQIQLAETMRNYYNQLECNIIHPGMSMLSGGDENFIYAYRGLLVRGGERVYHWPRGLTDAKKEIYNLRAENLSGVMKRVEGPEYYVYYIEKETDIDFDNNMKMGHFNYIKELFEPGLCKLGVYEINSFEDFARDFLKTDAHWNNRGSYRGYVELLNFLGAEGEPLQPGDEFVVGGPFSGSKGTHIGAQSVINEDMYAYHYDFLPMEISINGASAEDYGDQNKPLERPVTYGAYYGADWGEIIFDTGNSERDNILIIGESFDNAILKLLAGHFNRTFSIDLRYYSHYMGQEFSIADYVAENDIDKVLFMGNMDYFSSEDFMVY